VVVHQHHADAGEDPSNLRVGYRRTLRYGYELRAYHVWTSITVPRWSEYESNPAFITEIL